MTKEIENVSASRDFIKSLEKGLNVIQTFSEENPVLSVAEIAEMTGYSRPTVRRILLTLTALGFAKEKNGRYMLTARVLSLGYSYLSSQNIWNVATSHMEDMVKQTKESASISVLDQDEIVYVARVPTERIMSITLNIGSRLPAYATSMGKVLIAYLPTSEREKYLENLRLKQLTEKTKANITDLREELDQIVKQGWALADEELEEGVRSIAVPIFNSRNEAYAAVNCSANAGRVSKKRMIEEFLPVLKDTASLISRDLSHYQQSHML
ncbi:IclR family transcriptional regulator C-terminal domain-containing protein [Aliibacillus thermotolerans]|uniref:IclR family transcriptional regulator C-terminal domain-containing protein n=1 Tax=Aliibacillus thermotolerans TaxID=1834418 RepID=A0ABW0U6Q3_9BACI|nr:IclR family transcriptional regulator C-terminal domain-containing protein [Aliibacillus thermotolerans]